MKKKKKKKKFEYKVFVPETASWFKRIDDTPSISLYDLPKTQIRKIASAWANNLIERRTKGINGKFILSV